LQKILHQQQQLVDEQLDDSLSAHELRLPQLREAMERLEHEQQQCLFLQTQCREQQAELDKKILQHQMTLQQLHVEEATLAAQIKAATPQASHQPVFENKARLFEVIQVEPHWQQACELIFANSLHSVVLDCMEELWPKLLAGTPIIGDFVCARKTGVQSHFPRLSEKVSGFLPAFPVSLEKIITATSLEEAFNWLPQIQDDESIITADGYWFGKDWLRVVPVNESDNGNLLARHERLTQVKLELETLNNTSETLQQARAEQQSLQQRFDGELEVLRQEINEQRQQIKENELTLANLQRQQQQQQSNKLRLQEAFDESSQQLEDLIQQQLTAEQTLAAVSLRKQQNENDKQRLEACREEWELPLQKVLPQLEDLRTARHQNEIHCEREQLTSNQLTASLLRDTGRLQLLQDSLENVAEQLLSPIEKDNGCQQDLFIKVEQQAELAGLLEQSRDKLETLQQQLDQEETAMRQGEKRVKNMQEQIQQQQLHNQALALRADNLLESLQELNFALHELQHEMAADWSLPQAEELLQGIVEKIRRLGAINLAAIEEYDNEAKRKKHLDEQYDDLMEALTILDSAIDKMDKETRQRLQITFDEVNRAFQTLFPRLFGGGRAMLELTCDNLLEAGVLVMAQPPGKRNSTIHLLSGGEKAMTAVALVFAIFQLNPSPFCMLDEVDAPLDDLNVGRFCALVKEMSHAVQFLLITHNKVTMELADHLIGVTMREPGVSRIVAVDVEQALALVEA